MDRLRDLSLRTKLLIALLLASIIPMVTLAGINVYQTRGALVLAAEQGLSNLATQSGSAVDAFLAANLDAVRSEAQIPAIVRALELPEPTELNEAAIVLRSLQRKDTINILSYGLVDRDGIVLVDTQPGRLGLDESESGAFRDALNSIVPVITPVEFRPNGEAVLTFSGVVRAPSGETLGVLRIQYRADILQQILLQSMGQRDSDVTVLLINDLGLRLADSEAPQLLLTPIVPIAEDEQAQLIAARRLPSDFAQREQPAPLTDLAQNLIGDDTRTFVAPIRAGSARQSQVAVVNSALMPWHIAYGLPVDTFLAPIDTQIQTSVIAALVLTLLMSAVAVVMARVLTQPILRLTEAARLVATGDLNVRAPDVAHDEIGTLGHTFNDMTTQLAESMAGLEQRVHERTRELQAALEAQERQSRELQEALTSRQSLSEQISALSMPLIPVTSDVLIVPLVGTITRQRLRDGSQRLLQQITGSKARTVMLDVTGLAVIDDEVALELIRLAAAVQLLGAKLMIAGIRPEIAQSLVSLGIQFEHLETSATLEQGLSKLMSQN